MIKSKVGDNKEKVVDDNGSLHNEDNSVVRKFREKLNKIIYRGNWHQNVILFPCVVFFNSLYIEGTMNVGGSSLHRSLLCLRFTKLRPNTSAMWLQ